MRHVGLLTFISFDQVTWHYKTIERDIRKSILKIQIEAPTKDKLQETALAVMGAVSVEYVHFSLDRSDVDGLLKEITEDIPRFDSRKASMEEGAISVNWRYTVVDDRICDVIIIK